MNKFKKIMLGALSVLTLGLFVVTGSKVEAATSNYSLDLTRITTTSDKAVLNTDTLNNSFLTVETEYCTARYKNSNNYCIEIVNSALSVTFQGTGTITVSFCSTGGSNESHFGLTNSSGSVLSASSTTATLLTSGDDAGYYTVTGTSTSSVTYSITSDGKYYLCSPNALTNRGCRIYTITMSDTYGAVVYHTVTYMDGETVLNVDSLVVDGNSATYIPSKNGYKFLGWYTDSNLTTPYENEAITADKTLYANFFDLSTGTKVLNASDLTNGTISEETYISGSIFTINAESSASVSIDGSTKSIDGHSFTKRIKLGGTGKKASRSILIEAPSKGTLVVYGMSSSKEERVLGLYNSSYTGIDTTGFSNDGNNLSGYIYEISGAGNYYLGSTNGGFNVYYLEFIPESITVMQQEAENQTIGEDAATYIRFIAIVKGVEDINSSDFTFKIYREKSGVTQSITRSVSTYTKLKLGGNTYSATLPGESSLHSFDGAYGTEFYAVFVIGLTNETYSGYKVYGGFTFNGTEYTTSGYTFA